MHGDTLNEALGIEMTEIGADYLTARMPVDKRTVQPYRILHGGASVCLAESLGSIASTLCIGDLTKKMAVGVEINANHLRPGTTPFVHGKARPVRVGRNIHVWNIEIRDDEGRLVCVSRITIAVVDRR